MSTSFRISWPEYSNILMNIGNGTIYSTVAIYLRLIKSVYLLNLSSSYIYITMRTGIFIEEHHQELTKATFA